MEAVLSPRCGRINYFHVIVMEFCDFCFGAQSISAHPVRHCGGLGSMALLEIGLRELYV
jgi:hypothetical protein